MSNFITKDELAKIAISKNLIKEYKSSNSERTVYLNDGTEFQIYLKNPYQTHLGIKISVNNKSIGNMLVLRPGQSFWLDRFLNDNKKFLFSTYKVEDTNEMRYAINNNGKVKIEFFHEKENSYNSNPIFTKIYDDNKWLKYDYTISTGGTRLCNDVNTCYYSNSIYPDCSAANTITANTANSVTIGLSRQSIDKNANSKVDHNPSLETGRVEKGGRSDQEFDVCDIDFDYYPFQTESILILPNSRKQIRVEDTRRKYCSQCGKKVSPKDKFCSNCGAKLN